MNEADLIKELEITKEKLNRALRKSEGLKMKGKIYEAECQTAKEREQRSNDLVMELLERQRELNVMLNRANIMLNRAHEAIALTSVEFNEMAKALPEPKKAEWSDRVSKINDLFKKTGVQDGEMLGLGSPETPSLDTDEMRREGEEQFSRKEAIWSRNETHQPQVVHAELIPEEQRSAQDNADQAADREMVLEAAAQPQSEPQRRSWWSRVVSGD